VAVAAFTRRDVTHFEVDDPIRHRRTPAQVRRP
jgi:hypothetical protein